MVGLHGIVREPFCARTVQEMYKTRWPLHMARPLRERARLPRQVLHCATHGGVGDCEPNAPVRVAGRGLGD